MLLIMCNNCIFLLFLTCCHAWHCLPWFKAPAWLYLNIYFGQTIRLVQANGLETDCRHTTYQNWSWSYNNHTKCCLFKFVQIIVHLISLLDYSTFKYLVHYCDWNWSTGYSKEVLPTKRTRDAIVNKSKSICHVWNIVFFFSLI